MSVTTALAAPSSRDEACYLALQARDARFDGHFFTGVTSTGIYCRPVCKVRTPKRENCRFFALPAQAESAGFRPCLRCRPELAPGTLAAESPALGASRPWSTQDASAILARQAAQMLDAPEPWSDAAPSIASLATRLGVSTRHVRRIFETHWGVSPLQYLQTRRLLSAKQLLTDTLLPVAQVATLSGFSSVRRFNTAFSEHYRMEPRQLRKAALEPAYLKSAPANAAAAEAPSVLVLKASYRPPYDVPAMLAFFANRQIEGMERVNTEQQTITRTLSLTVGTNRYNGWVQAQFVPEHCQVILHISESLACALPTVLARLRALLDLDADPLAIHARLGADFPGTEGLRVPGCMEGFELAVRAILGQQVTVRAACTLAARLVERYGAPLEVPLSASTGRLTHLFPTAHALCAATGDDLGQLGIVRQRQRAIAALAHAVDSAALTLHPGSDVATTMAALQALPGIGPWTAHYIAMRALRWPDAFPAGDVALHKALGVQDHKNPQQAAEVASERWRPWRSYAVVRAWARLPQPTSATKIVAACLNSTGTRAQ